MFKGDTCVYKCASPSGYDKDLERLLRLIPPRAEFAYSDPRCWIVRSRRQFCDTEHPRRIRRMMSRRQVVIALGANALAAPLALLAQQPSKLFRVGLLGVVSAATYARQVEALRQGFRDLGYVE